MDEAVEQHIQGSLYLRNSLLSHLYPSASHCPPELAFNESISTPCSLLEKLFPTEFSLTGSLGLPASVLANQGLVSTSFFVDEVQIRYLIKVPTN